MACSDTYFPKRTHLVIHTAEQLASLASVLNRRPRSWAGRARRSTSTDWLTTPRFINRLHRPLKSARDNRSLFDRHLNHQVLT